MVCSMLLRFNKYNNGEIHAAAKLHMDVDENHQIVAK